MMICAENTFLADNTDTKISLMVQKNVFFHR